MNRKVDLIHVFNSAGVSALSEAHLVEQLAMAQAEIDRLRRLLATAERRLSGRISESAN